MGTTITLILLVRSPRLTSAGRPLPGRMIRDGNQGNLTPPPRYVKPVLCSPEKFMPSPSAESPPEEPQSSTDSQPLCRTVPYKAGAAPAGSGPGTTSRTGKSCRVNPINLRWHLSLDDLSKHVNAAKERTPQPLGTWTKAHDPDYVGSRARLFKDSKRGRKDQERVNKATDLRSEVAIADPCLLYLQMLRVCILMDHPSAFKTAPGKGSSSAGAAGPCVCVKASQRRSPLRPRLFTQTATWPRGGGLCAVFL